MRYQGLFAIFAGLLFTTSVLFYVFFIKLDGDYELVRSKGFFTAWKIKSEEKEAEQQKAEEASSPTEFPENDQPAEASSAFSADRDSILTNNSDETTIVSAENLELPPLKAPWLKSIPWEDWELRRAFVQASSRFCRLLPSGTSVNEDFRPKNVERTVFEGRPTVFKIGLEVDPLARGKLPVMSKSTIEGYLDDHLLAIQPVVLKTAKGFSFTGEVRCAFFDRHSPTRTLEPEAMIATAVREFRVLGVYDETGNDDVKLARTLVMAFRFMKQENELNLVISKPVEAFEMMIIHLSDSQESSPAQTLSFATAENRKDLQLLSLAAGSASIEEPSVKANIRFEKFHTMGMYPADPVVTGIRNRVVATMPLDDFQKQLQPLENSKTVMLSEILEQFPSSAKSMSP